MSFNIAVAGKGGTGKTALTSLIIRYLRNNGMTPVLAVDADPNANLGDGLGMMVENTIGSVFADFEGEKINIPGGMVKSDYLEYKLNEIIAEGNGVDLVTMGRGAGPGCYCFPNQMLRKFVDDLSKNYPYMAMDNEAGMEHLSRRTTQNVDELLLVSDHSVKGVRTIARLRELIAQLKLEVRRQSVVVNFVAGELNPLVRKEMDRLGIEPAAIIPFDGEVSEYDLELKSLLELPDTSVAVRAVDELMAKLIKRGEKVAKK